MPFERTPVRPVAAAALAGALLLSLAAGAAGAQVPPEPQPVPQPQPQPQPQPGGGQRGPMVNPYGRRGLQNAPGGRQGRPGVQGGFQPGGVPGGVPGGLPGAPGQPTGPGSRANPAPPAGTKTGVDYRSEVANLKQRHSTAVSRLPATIRPLDRQAMAVVEQFPLRAQWGYLMTFDEYASLDAAFQAKLPVLVQKLARLTDAERRTYVNAVTREFNGRGTSTSNKEAQRVTLRLLDLTDPARIPPAAAAPGAPGAPAINPLPGFPAAPGLPAAPR